MPNHISYVDPLALYVALPFRIKRRLAFMAATDVLYSEFKYVAWLAELFFNSVMLNRQEGQNIKVGLDYIGTLLDKHYSVVFFPEGKVSTNGSLQPLRKGPGLLAVEMSVSIIPVRIIGSNKVVPPFKLFPRKIFGRVKVIFGKPLRFNLSDNYEDALFRIWEEMRKINP
jgi:long-chain acyl-CoA synthetase